MGILTAILIWINQSRYCLDWAGGPFTEALGNQEAVIRAEQYGANIKYDAITKSPFYDYMDANKAIHIVWFEDSRSMMAKFNLVNRYGLRGVSYWVLGKPFPQNWPLLDSMFRVKKI
jgi:spore germination protein